MLIEEFNAKYTTISFAAHSKNYVKNTRKNDLDSLFHMHKELEIMLVLDGVARVYIDKQVFDIQKGDIVLIPPYTPHRYTIFSDFDFRHCCICFDLALLNDTELKENLENGSYGIDTVIRNDNIYSEYILNAFEANMKKEIKWEMVVIGNMMLLFSALVKTKRIYELSEKKEKSVYFLIVDEITRRFTSELTSSEMAKTLHMNHSYFCRLFRKSFGYCFHNYLCIYRIEKSKSLLKNTDFSVSQIASMVGFNNLSYFSKKFKEYTFVSPKEYRYNKTIKG